MYSTNKLGCNHLFDYYTFLHYYLHFDGNVNKQFTCVDKIAEKILYKTFTDFFCKTILIRSIPCTLIINYSAPRVAVQREIITTKR